MNVPPARDTPDRRKPASSSVVERLLLLRTDPRDVVPRVRAMVIVSARDPHYLELLLAGGTDLTEEDWLTLFVTGGYFPSLRIVDAAMAELRGEST